MISLKSVASYASCLLSFTIITAQQNVDVTTKGTLITTVSNSSKVNQTTHNGILSKKDTVRRSIKLNWELASGQINFINSKIITSQNNTGYQLPNFNYYFSISMPIIKSYERFGTKIGIGPHLKNFGINKLIQETNNKVTFTDIHDTLNIKASIFQQLLVDLPLALYYDTKINKNSRFLSVEWGVIPGIEVKNKRKTYSEDNKVVTLKYKEDILGTQKFQIGNSLKISFVKNRGAFSSRMFIQGVYYSTNVFNQTLNSPTQNYEIKFGLQITANQLWRK